MVPLNLSPWTGGSSRRITGNVVNWKVAVRTYIGLFLVTLATVTFELLLPRIFSVMFFHHLAFVAISVAMIGTTLGSIVVYLNPQSFSIESHQQQMAQSSLMFALTVLLIPAAYWHFLTHPANFSGLFLVAIGAATVPFIFSGIYICVALTKTDMNIGKLYAADLLGAACGCVFLIPLLDWYDGPSAALALSGLAAAASLVISYKRKWKFSFLQTGLALALIGGGLMVHNLRVDAPAQDWWNCYSRIRVWNQRTLAPDAWGLSPTWPQDRKVCERTLEIDRSAITVITKFDGDLSKVEHLKNDVTNLAYELRSDARVLVIGVGGGRDILSALAFHEKQINGVEINPIIISLLTKTFGDFAGHLEHHPEVKLIVDEARSFIAHSSEHYDVIQVSLIDTSAATATGAFVFTEHALYTVEAWRHFLDHLTDRGILSISRWYSPEHEVEALRLTNLAVAALHNAGVADTRNHIVIVALEHGGSSGRHFDGVATMLVSKSPFSQQDLERIKSFAKDKQFRIILSPTYAADPVLGELAAGVDTQRLCDQFPLDISATTDDRPFYLFFLRLKDFANLGAGKYEQELETSASILILGLLLKVMLTLTIACIAVPAILARRRLSGQHSVPLLTFFACIGMGFMLVELSQMQRLVIFLGHPVYGLSVVLFTLLLASGLGSYSVSFMSENLNKKACFLRLSGLLVALFVFGALTPCLTSAFEGGSLPIRIAETFAVMAPIGAFMGMLFPMGMMLAKKVSNDMTPWLWGVNGATSVFASVLATALSLALGISFAYWVGTAFYVLACLSFVWALAQSGSSAS
jgi:predicted membrane-bound spermidine synthase